MELEDAWAAVEVVVVAEAALDGAGADGAAGAVGTVLGGTAEGALV